MANYVEIKIESEVKNNVEVNLKTNKIEIKIIIKKETINIKIKIVKIQIKAKRYIKKWFERK